jgi:hypothetical protein
MFKTGWLKKVLVRVVGLMPVRFAVYDENI